MGKYEKVERHKSKNRLLEGVDCYRYNVCIPLEVKEAAKKRDESVQDFIFKAVLKELKQNIPTLKPVPILKEKVIVNLNDGGNSTKVKEMNELRKMGYVLISSENGVYNYELKKNRTE